MRTTIFKLVCAAVLAGILTSCIGAGIVKPGKCVYALPTVGIFDHPVFGPIIRGISKNKATDSSKNDFLREWGKPDSIERSADKETWIYNKNNWCGFVPCYIICVPLMLPVCGGFDQLTFVGDNATLLKSDSPHMYGFIFPAGVDFGEGPPQCRKWPDNISH